MKSIQPEHIACNNLQGANLGMNRETWEEVKDHTPICGIKSGRSNTREYSKVDHKTYRVVDIRKKKWTWAGHIYGQITNGRLGQHNGYFKTGNVAMDDK